MVYAIKLLLFVLFAAGAAAVVLRPAFAGLFTPVQYKRAWTWLFVVTIVSFLSLRPDLYVFLLAIAAMVAPRYLGDGDVGKVNAFLLFLLPLPPIGYTLGGLEGLNYVLRLEHVRVMSLVLFTLPAFRLMLRQRRRDEPSLRMVDLAVLAVQVWNIFLITRYASLTILVRTVVEAFCDILIPYYVITRTLRTSSQLREAASYLVLGCVFIASVACVESAVQRNLYGGLQWVYGVRWESTVDLMRGGFLRVEASTPQPIVLAFIVTFGMALWTWLKGGAPRDKWVYAVYLVFGLALVSTWSRGPWLGAALMVIAFALQRWLSPRVFGYATLAAIVGGVALKATGSDSVIMSGLTALFGSTRDDLSTITYRRELLDATLALIKQSPWLGVPNYETALQGFRQGEGMIDLVNTYLVVMINGGVIGLVLYLLPYVLVVAGMLGVQARQRETSKAALGRFAPAFIAVIIAMLFIVFTASTLDAMKYLLALGISLPVAWLARARQGGLVEELPLPQPEAAPRNNAYLPGPFDRPGTFPR